MIRFDYQTKLLTYLQFNFYLAYHGGKAGEFNYGVDIPPLPEMAINLLPLGAGNSLSDSTLKQLKKGVSVPQPTFDIGIGLKLQF